MAKFLEQLDEYGLILTDDDLIKERLKQLPFPVKPRRKTKTVKVMTEGVIRNANGDTELL